MPTNNILYRSFKKDYGKLQKILLMPIDAFPISSSNGAIPDIMIALAAP